MAKFLGISKDVPFKGDIPKSNKIIADDFERLVFAPDPASGNPCSSLAYMAKGDDEVSRYIREHYLGTDKGVGTGGLVSSVDADSALALVPDFGETRESYMQRVTDMIRESYESED